MPTHSPLTWCKQWLSTTLHGQVVLCPRIWGGLVRAIKCCPAILESSPVVIIFKEEGDQAGQYADCRQLALHNPPYNTWGVDFSACGNGCNAAGFDFVFHMDKGAMRCYCTLCGWRSCRVKYSNMSDIIGNLCPELPSVFWHAYLLSPHLCGTFAWIMKDQCKVWTTWSLSHCSCSFSSFV